MRVCTVAAIFVALAVDTGCGQDDGPGPCMNPPTFTRDIAPLAEAKCATCHAPGVIRRGAPPDLNFDRWPSIEPVVADFADAITSGRQPPPGVEPAVTAEERQLVSLWRTCGFME